MGEIPALIACFIGHDLFGCQILVAEQSARIAEAEQGKRRRDLLERFHKGGTAVCERSGQPESMIRGQ